MAGYGLISVRVSFACAASLAILATVFAGPANASPQGLYRALLTTPYSGLPSDFYAAKVGVGELSDNAKKYHAVGAVDIDIDAGSAGLSYIVFPSPKDAYGRFTHPDAWSKEIKTVGKVPGYKIPSTWANGSITGDNAFGKKVTNGVTFMGVQRGSVVVIAFTISTANEHSGDVPGTLALLRSALAHLGRVQARITPSRA